MHHMPCYQWDTPRKVYRGSVVAWGLIRVCPNLYEVLGAMNSTRTQWKQVVIIIITRT